MNKKPIPTMEDHWESYRVQCIGQLGVNFEKSQIDVLRIVFLSGATAMMNIMQTEIAKIETEQEACEALANINREMMEFALELMKRAMLHQQKSSPQG